MIRLHIPAIPHTITRDEFSNCAYTGKVLRFVPMMMSRGFEVYHYGVETSTINATNNIQVLTKDDWERLRIISYKQLHPKLEINDIKNILTDEKQFIGDLANYDTPLYHEFNSRFKKILSLHYRSTSTDLVCLPYGPAHELGISDLNVISVESGIGYENSYKSFRIFESYAHLHNIMSKERKKCEHNWFVIPNYYNILEWPLNLFPNKQKIGFLGRIFHLKGCQIICEVAKKFPNVEFILCGQGDPTFFLKQSDNLKYKPPIYGKERGEYLGELSAVIVPSIYLEPFCGVNVEAQLCGTPVITNDFGAFVETVEHFKTGMLCHTLADFCEAVQLALDGKYDRQYIRERAVKKYDMYHIAKQYEYAFKNILDIYNGNGGWYSNKSHIELLNDK